MQTSKSRMVKPTCATLYTRAHGQRVHDVYTRTRYSFVRGMVGVQKKRSNTKLQERIETTFVSALQPRSVTRRAPCER